MKLPAPKRSFILRFDWIVEGIAAVGAAVSSSVGLYKHHQQIEEISSIMERADRGKASFDSFWWVAAAALLVIIGAIWKVAAARAKSKAAAVAESPTDIVGCCYLLRAFVLGNSTVDVERSLRVTVYRCHREGRGPATELEQITPYVNAGGHGGGQPGRRLPINVGIVGRVAREGQVLAVSCVADNHEQFEAEMVRDWGFTTESARELNRRARSWMGVPLVDRDGRVVGVVYLDSAQREYFTMEVQQRVLLGCGAMTAFVRERYK